MSQRDDRGPIGARKNPDSAAWLHIGAITTGPACPSRADDILYDRVVADGRSSSLLGHSPEPGMAAPRRPGSPGGHASEIGTPGPGHSASMPSRVCSAERSPSHALGSPWVRTNLGRDAAR